MSDFWDFSADPERLTAEVALLDAVGTIESVNYAWNSFCLANGGHPELSGVGVSYLKICDAADDEPSQAIARAIRAALSGDLPAPESVEIVCAPYGRRDRFDVLISQRTEEAGAVVSLSRIHEREASVHEYLTNELMAVGNDLQQLLNLHGDPARIALDPTLAVDLQSVVSRLWDALLGPDPD